MTQIDGRIQKKLFERIRLLNREPVGDILDPTTGDQPKYLHDVFTRACWVRVISAVPSIDDEKNRHSKVFRLSSAFDKSGETYQPKNEPLASVGGFATEGGKYRPHSGITGISTEFQNHSIQNITINWKFYDRSRFDDYQNALLKHGRAILVEFGWGDPNEQQSEEQVNDPETMLEYFESITEKILRRGGDYYAASGVISGFTWNVVEGGAFECTTTVTSMGTALFKSQINTNLDAQYPEVSSQTSAKSLESAYRKANFTFSSFMVQLNEAIGIFNGDGDMKTVTVHEGSAEQVEKEQLKTKRGNDARDEANKDKYEEPPSAKQIPLKEREPERMKVVEKIRKIDSHYSAGWIIGVADEVDKKGKDGDGFLQYMLLNMVKGGNDIFPQNFWDHEKTELRFGAKKYLEGSEGIRS